MKQLMALFEREWLEWRTFWVVVGIIFLLFVAILGYGSYRISQELESHSFTINRNGEDINIQMDGKNPMGDKGNFSTSDVQEFLEIWGYVLRGMMEGVNILIIFLALFYLTDSLYKERSDQSTFYFRSLPVSDLKLLSSKLLFGTVGILLVSLVLSSALVLYLHLIFPSAANDLLIATGISLSQFNYPDLFGDWIVFHFVEFLWLLPFAAFFMFVSATVKNRPLLIGVGTIIVLAIVGIYLEKMYGIPNQIVDALGAPTEAYHAEWLLLPPKITTDTNIELLGGFAGYLLSIRTLISVVIGGAFFWGSFAIYRKNIEVS